MAKSGYFPKSDAGITEFLKNFSTKLPTYAAKYDIEPETIADMVAVSAYWDELVTRYQAAFKEFNESITEHKLEFLKGPDEATQLRTPTVPMPAVPPSNFKGRVSKISNDIKNHKDYIEADGIDLGIVGDEQPLPDQDTYRPDLKLRHTAGGQPEILWKRGLMTALEIQRKDANGNWQLLAIDTEPNYTDTSALPAPGQSEVRTYRAIFLLRGARYGQWSSDESFTVMG